MQNCSLSIFMCCHHFQSKLFLLITIQSCRHSLGCICMQTLALSPAFRYCVLMLFWSLPGASRHKEEVPKHHCSPVKSSVLPSLIPEPLFFSYLFLEDIFWISWMVILLRIYLLLLLSFFSHPFLRKNLEDPLSQHKKYASAVGK